MKHRLGVIGYGNMGSWHCDNVRDRIAELEVALVYDIDEKRRALARERGFSVCETEKEFFEADVDLVLVATPNSFHKEHCIKAMEHGKNVVSEKPPCLNLSELREVLDASARTGKLYTVHHNRRFDLDYAIMKSLVKSNSLGKLFHLNSRLCGNRGFANAGWKSLYEAGGGLLYDWGIHMIDQILCLFEEDRPVSVCADLQRVRMPKVDDVCRITVGFESGMIAHCVADLWCYIPEARWHLEGSDGTAIIDKWFEKEGRIIRAKNQSICYNEGCIYTPNGMTTSLWPRATQDLEELSLPEPEGEPRWESFYENVLAAIEGREKPLVTQQQIMNNMNVLMAAFESAKNNTTVMLDER